MKKIINILLVSLMMVGCGKVTTHEKGLKEATSNFEELDNYRIETNLKMIISDDLANSSSKTVTYKTEGIVDVNNKTEKHTYESIEEDDIYKLEIYYDYNQNIIYMSEDNNWEFLSIDDSIEIFNSHLLNIISNSDNFRILESDNNSYNYEVTLSYNEIRDYVGILGNFIKDNDLDVKISISIDKKSGHYSKISMDIKDLLKEDYDDIILGTYEIVFSNYNRNSNVDIPISVLENASDTAQKLLQSSAIDVAYGIRKSAEIQYMLMLMDSENEFTNDITYVCSDGACKNGDKELEISGTTPSSGLITIKTDGTILFSDIVINGYSCNIPTSGAISCEK